MLSKTSPYSSQQQRWPLPGSDRHTHTLTPSSFAFPPLASPASGCALLCSTAKPGSSHTHPLTFPRVLSSCPQPQSTVLKLSRIPLFCWTGHCQRAGMVTSISLRSTQCGAWHTVDASSDLVTEWMSPGPKASDYIAPPIRGLPLLKVVH